MLLLDPLGHRLRLQVSAVWIWFPINTSIVNAHRTPNLHDGWAWWVIDPTFVKGFYAKGRIAIHRDALLFSLSKVVISVNLAALVSLYDYFVVMGIFCDRPMSIVCACLTSVHAFTFFVCTKVVLYFIQFELNIHRTCITSRSGLFSLTLWSWWF